MLDDFTAAKNSGYFLLDAGSNHEPPQNSNCGSSCGLDGGIPDNDSTAFEIYNFSHILTLIMHRPPSMVPF